MFDVVSGSLILFQVSSSDSSNKKLTMTTESGTDIDGDDVRWRYACVAMEYPGGLSVIDRFGHSSPSGSATTELSSNTCGCGRECGRGRCQKQHDISHLPKRVIIRFFSLDARVKNPKATAEKNKLRTVFVYINSAHSPPLPHALLHINRFLSGYFYGGLAQNIETTILLELLLQLL